MPPGTVAVPVPVPVPVRKAYGRLAVLVTFVAVAAVSLCAAAIVEAGLGLSPLAWRLGVTVPLLDLPPQNSYHLVNICQDFLFASWFNNYWFKLGIGIG